MAKTSVEKLASDLRMPTALLIKQLTAAGIAKEKASDQMSEQDETRLLEYLRESHGEGNAKSKIVLSRRESSNDNGTNRTRTVQVEVRKKRVFVKRESVGERYLVIDGIFERSVLGVFRIVRGFANLKDLAEISVPYEMEEIDDAMEIKGQQRKLDTQHAERIKRYLERGEQRFLPEVILSVRAEVDDEFDKLQKPIGVRTTNNDDGIAIQRKWKGQENSVHQISIDRQKLDEILTKKLIRRLDGNHRLALASTLQTDPHLATKYLAPFCIVLLGPEGEAADDYSESLIFHTINSTALPLESEHALKLILGQNADYDMPPDKEFAYSPDLHFTRLLRDGLINLSKPVRARLGNHPLTSLRGAVRGLLDMDPKVAKDLATLRKYSKELVAALSDIVTRLEPSQPSLCKAEFFIELAARVWMASPGDGDYNPRVNAAVSELEQLAAWLGKDGLVDLREGQSLSKQVLDIFAAVRKRMPKNVFLARWYPSTTDGEDLKNANLRLKQIRQALKEIEKDEGTHLELVDMGTQTGTTFPIHAKMYDAIASADIILIDLTGARPNVCVEAGYALRNHEKNRLIFIFQPNDTHKAVPFDLNTFRYELFKDTGEIPDKIKPHISAILRGAAIGV
jgi:hypothetical protein